MENGHLPRSAELDVADVEAANAESCGKFAGTDNARQLRLLHALMLGPCRREDIDRIAGVSNGPDVVGSVRRLGMCIPCTLTSGIDRDGNSIRFGVYSFTDADRRKAAAFLRLRARKATP